VFEEMHIRNPHSQN